MPFKSPDSALRDILHNIDLAEHFTAGLEYAAFRDDMRTLYAVTRCFEIISEASRRLSPAIKERFPEIPWKDVAGSGNIYRHNYEDVLERRVWQTIHEALPPLRTLIDAQLKK